MLVRRSPTLALVVALAVGLALALGGCATGFNAETNQEYAAAVGTNARVDGEVDLLNALFVTNPDGTATLAGTVVARGSDTLTGVSVAGDDAEVALDEPVRLEAGQPLRLGEEQPLVVATGDLEPGQFLRTTLTFEQAGDLSLDAPVVERTSDYAGIDAPPLVLETTEPTDGPSGGPTEQPTDEPTDEPTS